MFFKFNNYLININEVVYVALYETDLTIEIILKNSDNIKFKYKDLHSLHKAYDNVLVKLERYPDKAS